MLFKSKGFTLIELLVVIAIIGILSSIVLSSLNSARQKGRDTNRVSTMKQLQSALALYFSTNGAYPGGDESNLAAVLVPIYIPSIPVGPLSDVYQYQALTSLTTGGVCIAGATNCASYHLGILLEQGANTGVLRTDKDGENVAGSTNGTTVDGLSTVAACGTDAGATATTDLCYDLAP